LHQGLTDGDIIECMDILVRLDNDVLLLEELAIQQILDLRPVTLGWIFVK